MVLTLRLAAVTVCAAMISVASASAEEGGGSGFVTRQQQEHPFGGAEDQQRLIGNICGTQMASLGAAGCGCLAERAVKELSEPQREYLILSVVQPPAAERTDIGKSRAELTTIATFLDAAARACAPAEGTDGGGGAGEAMPAAPGGAAP